MKRKGAPKKPYELLKHVQTMFIYSPSFMLLRHTRYLPTCLHLTLNPQKGSTVQLDVAWAEGGGRGGGDRCMHMENTHERMHFRFLPLCLLRLGLEGTLPTCSLFRNLLTCAKQQSEVLRMFSAKQICLKLFIYCAFTLV